MILLNIILVFLGLSVFITTLFAFGVIKIPNKSNITPTTTKIPTTTVAPTNAIYFKKPINLINNSNLKLQILYNLANSDTGSLSINFTVTPTVLECISTDSTKNNVNIPIKNNDILRIHEVKGDGRYISNYNSIEECQSRDCIFNYETRIALGFSPSDSLKVFAFLDDYGKYKSYNEINNGYFPIPVPKEYLDFTIICFDSLDNQIMDNNYIVTSNTKFRLKMRNMYLDGNPTCIRTAFFEQWCSLNLVPMTNKTPSQLFTFINV